MRMSPSRPVAQRAVWCLLLATGAAACAGRGPAEVSPQEAPGLAARLQQDPNNGALLSRYAQALLAAGNNDSAQAVGRRAMAARPADAVPVLVVGQALERGGQYDPAIALYDAYLAGNGNGSGAPAVRARQLLARRDQASALARRALLQEQQLAQQPGDDRTVGILPLQVVGDTSYQPLGRGLAQMMISDIGLLQRFRLVERVQLGALLEEMRLGQTNRVDVATAARVGRLIQAGRMVQGTVSIPEGGPVRLDAAVVGRTGEVANADQVNGQMRDLLRMEKDLVVSVVTSLGYTLSEAERRAILENGTQNLQAFLAYSRGLLAEDAGDYSRAAAYFGNAVQADPGFQAARNQQQAAAAAPAVQQAQGGQVAVVVAQTGLQAQAGGGALPNALQTGLTDLAGQRSEQTAPGSHQTGQQSTSTTTSAPPATTTGQGTTSTVTGTVNVRFVVP